MTESDYNVFTDERSKHPVKAWTKGVSLEAEAKEQLLNLATLPFIHKHIAVMPDAHAGKGSTIGSVIATTGAIIPAAVGVDLGCGMTAVHTGLKAKDLPDDLKAVRLAIEKAVPHGRTNDGKAGDRGAWCDPPDPVVNAWRTLEQEYALIVDKHPKLDNGHVNHVRHLGTLGTGNHFIELCTDETGDCWLMLHSGSRGVGNRIGTYFIELARQDMKRYFIDLPDRDLAYLPEGSKHFNDYVEAVEWAQRFAHYNRTMMMSTVRQALLALGTLPGIYTVEDSLISCHHNYVAKENHFGSNVWVTRKGAVRARKDDLGLIPGSMGVGSYVVRGKGNPESFNSCSHGAGRAMSRTRAKATITLDEHIEATKHVECRKDSDVLDETPGAYKPLEDVMKAQESLVEIVHKLTPLVCVKG